MRPRGGANTTLALCYRKPKLDALVKYFEERTPGHQCNAERTVPEVKVEEREEREEPAELPCDRRRRAGLSSFPVPPPSG
jgi:hypothetical protein